MNDCPIGSIYCRTVENADRGGDGPKSDDVVMAWLPIGSTKGKEEVMGVLACLVMAWEVPRERNHLPQPAQGNERVGDHRTIHPSIHPSSLAIYPRGLEMTERASKHERRVRRAMFIGSIFWGSLEEPSGKWREVQLYFEHKRDFYES